MRSSKIQKQRKAWAIVGDGYSEKIYFEGMRAAEKLTVQVKPELPSSAKGGEFMGVFKKADALLKEGYDRVFCIIDYDTILFDQKIQQFEVEKAKIEKRGAVVLTCNPCFEIWFLLHFQKTGKAFSNCDAVGELIRKSTPLSDYSKEQEYHRSQNFYEKLHPFLAEKAIPNAQFLEQNRDLQAPNFSRCELFKLFFELGIVQKKA